ncbi:MULTISPECIES: DUF5688 family protein [unclassified Butyrivibrio]|uniref:DUF5688 family protein n=1 Tax=unclassified Butyrivibrio TaxID=2639466 RepID=UPI0003B71076|nr:MULTISPECIES: DUF5688 family protein [unclassified Butyrivibrio]
MDFETFRENLARDIKETLEARTGTDFEVEHRTAERMNGSYEAIVVKPADSEVGVSLNATTLYQDYESGVSYENIAKGATDLADRSLRNQPEFDVDSFKDYDKMKGTLAMEVVSKERNAELLDTVPHKDIEDMSVVYRFVLGETPAGSGTILVTNQMLENYGITADQLHADAMKTAPEVRPLVIEGMCEVLAKQMGVQDLEMLGLNIPPEQEQIFVASVEGNVHGAGVLAYENFMEKASERVGGESFFILPSSIHEILIVPDNGIMDLRHLESMVREVNATTVDPSEQLTDNVYHYDAKEKVFELGEKYVERQAAKEARGHEASEKKSLLGDLKAAKDEASKTPHKDADIGEKSKDGKSLG